MLLCARHTLTPHQTLYGGEAVVGGAAFFRNALSIGYTVPGSSYIVTLGRNGTRLVSSKDPKSDTIYTFKFPLLRWQSSESLVG